MKKFIGAVTPVLALFLILAMTFPVSASWNSDLGTGTAVTIGDKDPFAVDSFLGVTSYYSSSSSRYTSSELIVRFYRDAYGGLSVSTSGAPTITTTGYEFKIPETPQQGDVVYGEGGHWAIVKSYSKSRGIITIFEQGNEQDGKAYKNRTLKYPSDSYTVYTPRSKTGYAYPSLTNLDTNSKVALNRGTVYDVDGATTAAAEKTSAGSTAASDKKSKTTTAANQETVSEKTESYDFTTYVGENEAEVVEDTTFTTSPMPEGYEEFFTSKNQSETDESNGEGAYDPNQSTQYTYTDTQAYDGNILATTEPVTEKDKSINPTLIFGIAMIGGIVCITGAGVFAGLVIKKRSEDDD